MNVVHFLNERISLLQVHKMYEKVVKLRKKKSQNSQRELEEMAIGSNNNSKIKCMPTHEKQNEIFIIFIKRKKNLIP